MTWPTPTTTHIPPLRLAPDEQAGASLLHLSPLLGLALPSVGHLLGPVAAWWALRRSPALDAQGREVINFQLTVTLVSLLLSGLVFALVSLGILGGLAAVVAPLAGAFSMFGAFAAVFAVFVPLMLLLSVVPFIFMVLGLLAAGRGEFYRYPLTLRFM